MVNTLRSSGIGGQAVLEGVMMKNKDEYAVAVRTPNNEIVVDKQKCKSISEKYRFLKWPLIRGVVAFCESLSIGMKALTYSSSFYEEEEEEEEGKIEKAFSKLFKEKAESVLVGITVILAVIIAVGLFVILPWFISEQLGAVITDTVVQALVEGLIRLVIFVVYVFAISLTEDIRRVYMYHGAEHKTINCVENGLNLTVENVKKQSKEHKRCGTSFILYVVIISIIFFMCIRVENPALRIVLRIGLVPVVAGIAYEFIRFAGNHDNIFIRILSRPGMWLQGITTREPDDGMIEVAIRSVEAVFDWQGYVEEVQAEKEGRTVRRKAAPKVTILEDEEAEEKERKEEVTSERKEQAPQNRRSVAAVKKADRTLRNSGYLKKGKPQKAEVEEENFNPSTENEKKIENVISEEEKDTVQTSMPKVATLKKAQGVRRPMQPIEEVRRDSILMDAVEDDDDDEILSALDKFFQ